MRQSAAGGGSARVWQTFIGAQTPIKCVFRELSLSLIPLTTLSASALSILSRTFLLLDHGGDAFLITIVLYFRTH